MLHRERTTMDNTSRSEGKDESKEIRTRKNKERKTTQRRAPATHLVLCILLTRTGLADRSSLGLCADDNAEGGFFGEPLLERGFEELSEAGLDVLLGEGVGYGDGEG